MTKSVSFLVDYMLTTTYVTASGWWRIENMTQIIPNFLGDQFYARSFVRFRSELRRHHWNYANFSQNLALTCLAGLSHYTIPHIWCSVYVTYTLRSSCMHGCDALETRIVDAHLIIPAVYTHSYRTIIPAKKFNASTSPHEECRGWEYGLSATAQIVIWDIMRQSESP